MLIAMKKDTKISLKRGSTPSKVVGGWKEDTFKKLTSFIDLKDVDNYPDITVSFMHDNFYADSRDTMLTVSLFFERNTSERNPFYTLKEYHNNNCISLKQLYLMLQDPTEYVFAMKAFGSYQVWENICKCVWFEPYITSWRKELELKLQALGFKELINGVSGKDSKTKLQAAKYLSDRGWKGKKESKRGRPTKDELEGAKKALARAMVEQETDLKRMLGEED